MVWKLVTDATWRLRSLYLVPLLGIGLVGMTVGTPGGEIGTSLALAGSMALAFFEGPLLSLAVYGQKEFTYLPLSRRQLWRARVAGALVVPVVLMLAAKLIALTAAWVLSTGSTLTLGTVLLSSVYDFAYVGAGLGLLTWSGLGRTPRAVFGNGRIYSELWIVSALLFVSGPAWPLLFRTTLATDWDQLGGGGWLLLAAGVGIGAATFFHSPTLAHSGRRQAGAAVRGSARETRGSSHPAIGIARLMGLEIAVSVGCILMVLSVCGFMAAFEPGDEDFISVLLLVMLSLPSMGPSMGVRAALRALRALPISTWTLSALLTAQPFVTGFSIWILLGVARMFLGSHVPALTVGLLCWLVGIASVANSLGPALAGSRFLRFGPLLPLMLLGFATPFVLRLPVSLPVDLLAPYVALGGVAAAFWLNVRTLRRSSAVYKPLKLPTMFATPEPSA